MDRFFSLSHMNGTLFLFFSVVSAAASQQCVDNNLHTYLVGLLHSQPGNVQLEVHGVDLFSWELMLFI